MKVITFEDIASLGISPGQCMDWAEATIKNKKGALLPAKISIKPFEGVFCNVMPGMLLEADKNHWGGVKVVTRYPNRLPSLESRILLMDAETGEFLALMDGTWITTMRTGAVAAHSTLLFAKKNFHTIGMMGLGNVMRATLIMVSDQLPDRELHIKLLRYQGQEEAFSERFRAFRNLHFTVVDTAEEMVKGSEVVLSGATYLPYDVCPDACFDEGVLVQPVHTLGFTNCDLFFDKVFADDRGHVCHFKNFARFRQFAEVCDVVNGETPGRENDQERILAYNIGVSIHDISFAAHIYRWMEERGVLCSLPDIDMKDPTEKFWV